MENWKDVKGYENLYEVSSLGRIRRKDSFVNTGLKHVEKKLVKGRILKQQQKRNGYLSVCLSKDSKVKTILVHRIVATAFLENNDKEHNTHVNHINANKLDNRVENLEWCTPQKNCEHAKINNLYNPPNKKKVRCKQLDMVFESSYAAAEYINNRYFGNSKQIKNIACKIRCVCTGIQKNAYNFTFCYI